VTIAVIAGFGGLSSEVINVREKKKKKLSNIRREEGRPTPSQNRGPLLFLKLEEPSVNARKKSNQVPKVENSRSVKRRGKKS